MSEFASAVASLVGIVLYASLLAGTNERLVEHGIKPIMARLRVDAYVGQVSMLTGAGIAFLFGVDLYAPLARAIGMTPPWPWAGFLLTGLVIGLGSNLFHDLWPVKTSTTTKEVTVTETTSKPAEVTVTTSTGAQG